MMEDSFDNGTPLVLTRYYLATKIMPVKITPDDDIATILLATAVEHFKKFPFNSLSFNLSDQEVPLHHRNALIVQLLENKGGSCFHHNAVFQAILADSGIQSRFISCLVRDPLNPGKAFDLATHIAIVFDYKGQSYLFDPGWDGTSLSIYPLPDATNPVRGDGKHQIRRTDDPAYPFLFEEVKADGKAVVRYDFNVTPAELADFKHALEYLNSKDYAFHTLFLFTKINSADYIIRFVNRRLIIQTIAGEESHNAELPEDMSIMEKLTELLGPQEGLLAHLQVDDFKNPAMGNMICGLSHTLNIAPGGSM